MRAAADIGAAAAERRGAATVARMEAMPADDDCFGPGSIRAGGRKPHPACLFRVKSPADAPNPA